MDPEKQLIIEIAKLARENNQMLHAMRRNAFFWGFLKFVVYMVLFAAPIWFFLTYVSGTLDGMVNTMNRIQGTATQAEQKFNGFQSFVNDIREKLPEIPKLNAPSTAEAN